MWCCIKILTKLCKFSTDTQVSYIVKTVPVIWHSSQTVHMLTQENRLDIVCCKCTCEIVAYLNNFQCSLLLVHVCCSQRYEIQWWWKMLHVMTLVLWMKRRLLHNRRIILTPVSSSFSVHIFWDIKIGCIIHYLFYYDVWMCIDHCFVLGWCANDKQIPTIPIVCKKWQVS